MNSPNNNKQLLQIQESIDKNTGSLQLDILLNILGFPNDEDFKTFLQNASIPGLIIDWNSRTVVFENTSTIDQLVKIYSTTSIHQFLSITSPDEYLSWAKNILSKLINFNPLVTPIINNEHIYDLGYFSKGSKTPIIVFVSYYIIPIVILYTFFILLDLFHISTFIIKLLAIVYILSLIPVIIILAIYASNSKYHNTILLFRILRSHTGKETVDNLIMEQQQLIHDNSRLRKLVIDTFIVFYISESENLAQTLMNKSQFSQGIQKPLGMIGLIPVVIDVETHTVHIPKLPSIFGYDSQIKLINKFI